MKLSSSDIRGLYDGKIFADKKTDSIKPKTLKDIMKVLVGEDPVQKSAEITESEESDKMEENITS